MGDGRHVKVLKLQILKPAGEMRRDELSKLLGDVRYRVFRLANLVVSEAYLGFHLWRTGRTDEFKKRTVGDLNRELRGMLAEEKFGQDNLDRISKTGAIPAAVADALSSYKVRGLTSAKKWSQVVRGKTSLPTFRADMPIPIRCDKAGQRRLQKAANGDAELDLMVCVQPYPRVVLQTGKLDGGPRAVLERLLDNEAQSLGGYRQRCLEVKYDNNARRWFLFLTYDFPAARDQNLCPETVVGVDLGFSCPLFAALSNGHARLGRRHFAGVAARVKSLQTQVMAHRRSVLTGGRSSLSKSTARSGHGRAASSGPSRGWSSESTTRTPP